MKSRFYSTVTFLTVLVSLLFAVSTSFACDGNKNKKSSDKTAQDSPKGDHHSKNTMGYESLPPVGTTAVCPVTKEKFKVAKDTPYSVYKGKTYVFCCGGCKPQFDKNPEKYL